ncbi:MAG: nitronate monooxygenase [Solirubrobacteraceae bacterium]|nr:nitronate monooxygenase [Solirubrobacteraceae bacterium]
MRTAFTELVGIEQPIVQAPMAGATTPRLVAQVCEAGALGSIAGAMLSPDALREEIRAVRSLASRPFAVNLFAPLPPPTLDRERMAQLHSLLAPHRDRLGLGEPEPPAAPAWRFEDQLAVVVEERVPVFSFTFGIPPLSSLGDTVVLGTATTAAEAAELERAGVHAVVAQGMEAGGHRGSFVAEFDEGSVPLAELVPAAIEACSLPVVAAGGLMTGGDVARMLELGAAAGQLGSAFLFCPEADVPDSWRQALRRYETVITDAYTGRPARAARTEFLAELMTVEPTGYPLQAALLSDVRRRDGYGFYLGGTEARRGRELPAAELVAAVAAELS